MNDNFSDKYSSGPVQRKQTFSPTIITAIIFLLIVLFALYRGYYAFLKSDAFAQYYVSGAVKKTTASPPPIQKNKQKHSKKKSIVNEEDEGDYAERLEIPAEQEEDSDSSNNDEIISSSNTYTDSPAPIPFPHKANPFEEAVMNGMSDISDGGKFSATKISSGYFKDLFRISVVKASNGTARYIFNGNDIYQYAFFPAFEKYAEMDPGATRIAIAHENFRLMYDMVYGNGSYAKNNDRLLKDRMNFANICSVYKMSQWHFVSIDGYSYGCSGYGFTVLSDQAVDKLGIIGGKPSSYPKIIHSKSIIYKAIQNQKNPGFRSRIKRRHRHQFSQ